MDACELTVIKVYVTYWGLVEVRSAISGGYVIFLGRCQCLAHQKWLILAGKKVVQLAFRAGWTVMSGLF